MPQAIQMYYDYNLTNFSNIQPCNETNTTKLSPYIVVISLINESIDTKFEKFALQWHFHIEFCAVKPI